MDMHAYVRQLDPDVFMHACIQVCKLIVASVRIQVAGEISVELERRLTEQVRYLGACMPTCIRNPIR